MANYNHNIFIIIIIIIDTRNLNKVIVTGLIEEIRFPRQPLIFSLYHFYGDIESLQSKR
jgi:hypothetical protein